jgi:hypothetical protein
MEQCHLEVTPHWLNRDRLFAYSRIALAWYMVVGVFLVWRAGAGVDPSGKPLGTDFISFWGASHAWWSGHPADAYDPAKLLVAQQLAVPGTTSVYGWFYPPTYFLLILPLALLPYLSSLALFCGATLALYVAALRRVVQVPGAVLLILAFPGVYLNLAHGQNGFLTAAIAGGALLLLDSRPLLAGVLVGLLAMKPHLGVLFPVALVAAGQWRPTLSAALATAVFVAASVLVVSPEAGFAFVHNLGFARAALDSGALPWAKMPTWFALVRLLGGAVALAYAVHALVAACTIAVVTCVWRCSASFPLRAAALMTGTLLMSPYLYDYDLAWLAFPIAWLAIEAIRTGWLRFEREVLAAAWILPASLPLAEFVIQPGPLVSTALLTVIARRAYSSPRCRTEGDQAWTRR